MSIIAQIQNGTSGLDARDTINAVITRSASIVPGATADGVTDDSTAMNSRNVIRLSPGINYYLNANTAVGTIISEGGTITISSGVVLTFNTIIGNDSVVIFKGAGTARSQNGTYSVGWYDGTAFNNKWDFCRRAFIAGAFKRIIIPYPIKGDPAANWNDTLNMGSWKLTDPMIFDDPENNCDIFQYAPLTATVNNMKCMIEYSIINKTEDIYWRNGISLDGAWCAIDGVIMHAAARIQHFGYSRIGRCKRDGVLMACDKDIAVGQGAGMDEIQFQFLNTTENGRYGINMDSKANHIPYGCQFDYLFNNGCKGIFGTAVVANNVLTGVNLNTNGPNGKVQDLRGFMSTQPLNVSSKSGNGRNASATPIISANSAQLITGVTIDTAGTAFSNGEIVCLTAGEAVLRMGGPSRATVVGRIFENQDDNSNLTSIHGAYMLLETTSVGGNHNVDIGPIRTISGRRPALISRDAAGQAAHTNRNRFSIRGWRIPNAVYGGGYEIQLANVDEASITDGPVVPSTSNIVAFTTNVTGVRMTGIAREWVAGNGNRVTFDGLQQIYSTNFGQNAITSINLTSPNITNPIREVTLMSNNSTILYKGFVSNTVFTDIVKGANVATTNVVLSGNTGADGMVTLSTNNNVFYIENKTGGILQIKCTLGM